MGSVPSPGGLQRGGGALGLAASSASLPLSHASRGGWDALGRWLLCSDPAALAQARQGWESSQAPAGAAGMGARAGGACEEDSSLDQSSLPTASQGAGGLLDLCWALHQAQPPQQGQVALASHPPWIGEPPTCTLGLARTPTLPIHSPSLSPLGQSCKPARRLKPHGGGGPAAPPGPACPLGHGTAPGTNLFLMPMPRGTMPHPDPQKCPHGSPHIL